MDIQFAKYKVLIEQQLEELIAEDVLGQSAKKTVELDQQTPRFEPCVTRRKVERSEPFEKGLDLMSVWGHHLNQ